MIVSVNVYKMHHGGAEVCDVLHDSGRLYFYELDEAPKTVIRFMDQASKQTRWDSVFKRYETNYRMNW